MSISTVNMYFMKSISVLLFFTSLLSVKAQTEIDQHLRKSVENPTSSKSVLKYGIEALSTWRSEYVYRGFDLASNSMEFQLAGQIGISNTETLEIGLFYGSATGEGDFMEASGFIDYSKEIGKYQFSAKLTGHEYNHRLLKSGIDFGGSVNYQCNDFFDISATVSYDTGAKGFYFETKISYFEEVNENSYVTLDAGISAVAKYYERSGIHHAFSTLSYTYNINDSVSVTPYITTTLGIHNHTKNHFISGLYFAVSF